MKKKIVLMGLVLICVQVMNAQQSPCEKTFDKAKSLYASKQYDAAKEQFKIVIKNCNSYKELAEEYVMLCEARISLSGDKAAFEANKSVLDEFNKDSQEIVRLKNRVSQLEEDNEGYRNGNRKLRGIIDRKNDSLSFWQDSIVRLSASIEKLGKDTQSSNGIDDSLRNLGNSLNKYLSSFLRNQSIVFDRYDEKADALKLIKTMNDNIGKAKPGICKTK